jgi:hypothetical protein
MFMEVALIAADDSSESLTFITFDGDDSAPAIHARNLQFLKSTELLDCNSPPRGETRSFPNAVTLSMIPSCTPPP